MTRSARQLRWERREEKSPGQCEFNAISAESVEARTVRRYEGVMANRLHVGNQCASLTGSSDSDDGNDSVGRRYLVLRANAYGQGGGMSPMGEWRRRVGKVEGGRFLDRKSTWNDGRFYLAVPQRW